MNKAQQAAWDVVYTASHCAPGTGLVLTREHALALIEMMPPALGGAVVMSPGGVTMPEEPTRGIIDAMWNGWCQASKGHRINSQGGVYRALYAHLAGLREPPADAPRKVKVEAWAQVAPTGDIRGLMRDRDMLHCVKHGYTEQTMQDVVVKLTGEYDAPEPPKPLPRIEWWIVGDAANGEQLYSKTARTEAERDSFYRSAWGTAGVKRVFIVEREVQG